MAEADLFRNMILNYRVSELNALLAFAGKSKVGRKNELQNRALELLNLNSPQINARIKEIYKSIPHSSLSQILQVDESDSQSGSSTSDSRSASQSSCSSSDSDMPKLPLRFLTEPSGLKAYHSKHTAQAAGENAMFPVLPDVKFKKLPFYDILGELLRPSSLVPICTSQNEANFSFHLTPQQAASISQSRVHHLNGKADYSTQIQIRFCLLETSCEQEDCFPVNLMLKLNGKTVPLPNPIATSKPAPFPRRPASPLDVTNVCRISSTIVNTINVSWGSDLQGRGYAIGVFLVNRLTFSDLLARLKSKGFRPSEYTRGLIKEKLFEDSDLEIATTTLRVSLACSIGKMRMNLPCRSTVCTHLQCFDASLFLQMNERKPKWTCPVCDKIITYDTLAIDGYFSDILNSRLLPADNMEVELNVDGSWSILADKRSTITTAVNSTEPTKGPEVCMVEEDELEVCQPPPAKKLQPYVIDLVSSSSSESEDETLENAEVRKTTIRDYFWNNPSRYGDFPDTTPTYYPSGKNQSSGNKNSNAEGQNLSKRSTASRNLETEQSSSPDIIELD